MNRKVFLGLLAILPLLVTSLLPSSSLHAQQAGDPYVDRVVSFTPGNPASECCNNLQRVLGPPDFNESAMSGWLTLGVGGSITSSTSQPVVPTRPPPVSGASPLADQTWVRLGGPLGGLGYDIRMDPRNPDVMYVTDSGAGTFKSTDGGQTWFPVNTGIDIRVWASGDSSPSSA